MSFAQYMDNLEIFMKSYNLGEAALIIVAVVFSFAALIVAREAWAWFNKTSKLERQLRRVQNQLELLQEQLESIEKRSMVDKVAVIEKPPAQKDSSSQWAMEPKAPPKRSFKIFH